MHKQDYRLGCIVMAAGNSERFSSNKLMAQFNGKTLYERTLDVIPAEAFDRVVVVTQYQELMEQAQKRGFLTLLNDHPEAGQSYTIALGIGSLQNADALMFMVADQPLLRRQSVLNAIELHLANPKNIIAMAFGDRRGNPCIFPRVYFPELFALTGDVGGSAVIKCHADKLLLSYVQDGRELIDVDTVHTLYDLIR